MDSRHDEIKNHVLNIAELAREKAYPDGFDQCLLAAAMLIEEAGDILAGQESGYRVSELMLLSARVEGLMTAPPVD